MKGLCITSAEGTEPLPLIQHPMNNNRTCHHSHFALFDIDLLEREFVVTSFMPIQYCQYMCELLIVSFLIAFVATTCGWDG